MQIGEAEVPGEGLLIPIADCRLRIDKVTSAKRFPVNERPLSTSKWYYSHQISVPPIQLVIRSRGSLAITA
jgi:hypothetical protein